MMHYWLFVKQAFFFSISASRIITEAETMVQSESSCPTPPSSLPQLDRAVAWNGVERCWSLDTKLRRRNGDVANELMWIRWKKLKFFVHAKYFSLVHSNITIMGLCKCPKKKVTTQFCFEHRVNVCEHCLVSNHPKVRHCHLVFSPITDYDFDYI